MSTTTRYIRLLSYENACSVIDFISEHENNKDGVDYSNITVGGLSTQVRDENWKSVEDFIKTLTNRYEITSEHPMKVEQKIVENLKDAGVIETTITQPKKYILPKK